MTRGHVRRLAFWIALGAVLRFAALEAKPFWTDEFATIAFSLGHGFLSVPLDRAITPDELMRPLIPLPDDRVGAVAARLFAEGDHPPAYFVLEHAWLRATATPAEPVSRWAARALSALSGVATIPATYALAWIAFGSPAAAQVSAALMATSPFGVYLAQEARHYTLAIALVAVSLCGLAAAARALARGDALGVRACAGWVGANGLGVATHYLFVVVVAAELLVLAGVALRARRWRGRGAPVGWAVAVAAGTAAMTLPWLPIIRQASVGPLVTWMERHDAPWTAWLGPLVNTLAADVTMLYLLPIQAGVPLVRLVAGVGGALLALGTAIIVVLGLRRFAAKDATGGHAAAGLAAFTAACVAIVLGMSYVSGKDATTAFRVQFVHFPAIVVLVAAGLASTRAAVVAAVLASLLGAVTVVTDLGYQKPDRSDLVAEAILRQPAASILIATPYRTHASTGQLMAIEQSLRDRRPDGAARSRTRYLLARSPEALRPVLEASPRPLDVWMVNTFTMTDAYAAVFRGARCPRIRAGGVVAGYQHRLYRCR